MDSPLFFFTPSTSTESISPLEHITCPDHDLEQLMCSTYDHSLEDFMLFEGCQLIVADELRVDALHPDQQDAGVNGGSYAELLVQDEALLSGGAQKEHDIDYGDSSPIVARTRRDRSKTIVAERKRRVRTKEKLYELRSLVPNITKMDKASIIADAVVYVKNLQTQSRNLVDEIRMLESSSTRNQEAQISHQRAAKISNSEKTSTPTGSKIVQVNAQGVSEGTFCVRLVGRMGDGTASSLYSAIDSLSVLNLESSNFLLGSEEFALTLILKVGGSTKETNASSIRTLVMSALSKEGFRF